VAEAHSLLPRGGRASQRLLQPGTRTFALAGIERLDDGVEEVVRELVAAIVASRAQERGKADVIAGHDHGRIEPVERLVGEATAQAAHQGQLLVSRGLAGEPVIAERTARDAEGLAVRCQPLLRGPLHHVQSLVAVIREEAAAPVPGRQHR